MDLKKCDLPPYQIELIASPAPEDRQVINEGLNAYNAAMGAPNDWIPLALFIRDSQGVILGGLTGESDRHQGVFLTL